MISSSHPPQAVRIKIRSLHCPSGGSISYVEDRVKDVAASSLSGCGAAMEGSVLKSLCESVEQIPDPRVLGRSDHLLVDIVGITILAVLCGADDFVAVATFAKHRREWLE